MSLELHYFGWIAERTGVQGEELELGTAYSVAELRDRLMERYPALRGMSFRIACDRELVQNETGTLLSESAEIALLPAYAGG